jgi:hypothetical protein
MKKSLGAGDRNRTRNLLFTKQLLCQLSYAGFDSTNRLRDFNLSSKRALQNPTPPTPGPRGPRHMVPEGEGR